MTAHAFKKAPMLPRRFSFVDAVKQNGDLWWIVAPVASRDPITPDRKDAANMHYMERGLFPRVETMPALDDYEPMIVDEHGFGYCAVREGYDGAPDSHCPIGVGRTKFQAIADLIECEQIVGVKPL